MTLASGDLPQYNSTKHCYWLQIAHYSPRYARHLLEPVRLAALLLAIYILTYLSQAYRM